MLGCNESNIIFQQHLCKLGQLRRSNGYRTCSTNTHTICSTVESWDHLDIAAVELIVLEGWVVDVRLTVSII